MKYPKRRRPLIRASLILIGVVIGISVLAVVGIYGVFIWGSFDGTVKGPGPAFAATDEKSFRILAATRSADLPALAASSQNHIVALAPSTRVRYREEIYLDPHATAAQRVSALAVLKVKVKEGPAQGKVLWVRPYDVGFYSTP